MKLCIIQTVTLQPKRSIKQPELLTMDIETTKSRSADGATPPTTDSEKGGRLDLKNDEITQYVKGSVEVYCSVTLILSHR